MDEVELLLDFIEMSMLNDHRHDDLPLANRLITAGSSSKQVIHQKFKVRCLIIYLQILVNSSPMVLEHKNLSDGDQVLGIQSLNFGIRFLSKNLDLQEKLQPSHGFSVWNSNFEKVFLLLNSRRGTIEDRRWINWSSSLTNCNFPKKFFELQLL